MTYMLTSHVLYASKQTHEVASTLYESHGLPKSMLSVCGQQGFQKQISVVFSYYNRSNSRTKTQAQISATAVSKGARKTN